MLTRRDLLRGTASGFGYLAFAALANEAAARDARGSTNPLGPKPTHFPAKAKHVIFLSMAGGPSHVDTFDYKPKLQADDGKPFSKSRFGGGKLMASPWKFNKCGDSGLYISELFPELGKQADDICLMHGMHTDIPNHPQAYLQMHCGMFQFPRPSLGSWVLYGLGTENANLPGFVTLSPPVQNGGPANYASSFLPAVYQGTRVGSAGFGRAGGFDGKVSNLTNSRQSTTQQRAQLDYLQSLNRAAADETASPGVEGLIESYELAFRMQADMPRVLDLSKETKATRERYGITGDDRPGPGGGGGGGRRGGGGTDTFGRQCLVARRLVEAGVRFVELTRDGWDHHRNLREDLAESCQSVDKPVAALLADLKERGLLKDTLVIFGGEFGRTPYSQGTDGRDHNNKGYTMWMAGGGVKPGLDYGATDEYGYEAVAGKMHVHDWHATVLHLLGLDHEKLTYRHAGRDMRLTDVKGNVVKDVMA
jgi:hypothetical protein